MAINSVATHEKSLNFLSIFGTLIGIGIFSKDYKVVNWRSVGVVLNIVTYSMVTIYCAVEFRNDLEKLVFCLVTYGFAIQVRKGMPMH
jgi:hypothetical protein